ncbi:MAG: DUF945 family protein, partial [Gammaproteobacteria bacterium]|nr:DUF945 family protein [Gammaproteobacteria bacterium]
MKKLIISVLVLVIIAVLALPKFIGSKGAQMHDNFFQQSAKQLMPGVVVESENMKDGWFNSEGTHRIKLSEAAFKNVFPGVKNVELDKEMDILVNTKFHHGPIAFSSLSGEGAAFSPVLAVGESTLQIDNNGKIIDLPGKLYTQVNATGSGGKAKYLIEEYTFQEENGSSINLDDVEIDFDISDKGEVVDGQGRSGKLSIHGHDGEKIVLSNMTFDADLEDKDGVWFGDS